MIHSWNFKGLHHFYYGPPGPCPFPARSSTQHRHRFHPAWPPSILIQAFLKEIASCERSRPDTFARYRAEIDGCMCVSVESASLPTTAAEEPTARPFHLLYCPRLHKVRASQQGHECTLDPHVVSWLCTHHHVLLTPRVCR